MNMRRYLYVTEYDTRLGIAIGMLETYDFLGACFETDAE